LRRNDTRLLIARCFKSFRTPPRLPRKSSSSNINQAENLFIKRRSVLIASVISALDAVTCSPLGSRFVKPSCHKYMLCRTWFILTPAWRIWPWMSANASKSAFRNIDFLRYRSSMAIREYADKDIPSNCDQPRHLSIKELSARILN